LTHQKPSILVYGYGNPGRQDDGAGIMLAEKLDEWIESKKLEDVRTDTNYQLNLEDAATVSNYDLVIFADASHEEIDDFRMEPLVASNRVEFTMHAVAPAFILHLCKEVFHYEPKAWLLHIKGYEWEFMAGMTEKAESNLLSALHYLQEFILQHMSGRKSNGIN
jgi:hydrogenase maturation protease